MIITHNCYICVCNHVNSPREEVLVILAQCRILDSLKWVNMTYIAQLQSPDGLLRLLCIALFNVFEATFMALRISAMVFL